MLGLFSPLLCIASTETDQVVLLAKGQTTEISIEKSTQYIIGNPEILSAKLVKNHVLAIRSKMTGYSSLSLLSKNRATKTFSIYVLSKRDFLAYDQLKNRFAFLKLETKYFHGKLLVKGTLNNAEDWIQFSSIITTKKEEILNQVSVSENLSKQIVLSIYKDFAEFGISQITCRYKERKFSCQFPQSIHLPEPIVNKWKSRGIHFYSSVHKLMVNNLKLSLRLVAIEGSQAFEFDSGLSEVSFNYSDLFRDGPMALLRDKGFSLFDKEVSGKLVASPIIVFHPKDEGFIELGSHLSYESTSKLGQQQVSWKFAGLRIKVKASDFGDMVHLNLETELTRPGQAGSIQGQKGKTSIQIEKERATKIFEIDYHIDGNQKSKLPILSKIPILKHLFTSTSKSRSQRKIIGVVRIENNTSIN